MMMRNREGADGVVGDLRTDENYSGPRVEGRIFR